MWRLFGAHEIAHAFQVINVEKEALGFGELGVVSGRPLSVTHHGVPHQLPLSVFKLRVLDGASADTLPSAVEAKPVIRSWPSISCLKMIASRPPAHGNFSESEEKASSEGAAQLLFAVSSFDGVASGLDGALREAAAAFVVDKATGSVYAHPHMLPGGAHAPAGSKGTEKKKPRAEAGARAPPPNALVAVLLHTTEKGECTLRNSSCCFLCSQYCLFCR